MISKWTANNSMPARRNGDSPQVANITIGFMIASYISLNGDEALLTLICSICYLVCESDINIGIALLTAVFKLGDKLGSRLEDPLCHHVQLSLSLC
jgi:hypothetical protein